MVVVLGFCLFLLGVILGRRRELLHDVSESDSDQYLGLVSVQGYVYVAFPSKH